MAWQDTSLTHNPRLVEEIAERERWGAEQREQLKAALVEVSKAGKEAYVVFGEGGEPVFVALHPAPRFEWYADLDAASKTPILEAFFVLVSRLRQSG